MTYWDPDQNGPNVQEHPQENRQEHPLHILKWYAANGVNLAVGDAPVNRFNMPVSAPKVSAENPAAVAAAPAAPQTANTAPSPQASNSVPANAEPQTQIDGSQLAAGAENLDDLQQVYRDFNGCALKLRASNFVFEGGTRGSDILIVGDAPSADDDLQGTAFSGRVGGLLDKMLASIGLDREKVYLTNVVPWRPPGNRNPSIQEINPCLPFLTRQVELAAPKLILCFGEIAARTVLADQKLTISRSRGQWRDVEFGAWNGPVLASLHPSLLLRQPAKKRDAWHDLLALQERIEGL